MMKFKVIFTAIFIISILFIFQFYSKKLPYNLKVFNIGTQISINDENGYPIIWESKSKCTNYQNSKNHYLDKPPCLNKLIKFSRVKNGVIICYLVNKSLKYVKITPKRFQNYAELDVIYKQISIDETYFKWENF